MYGQAKPSVADKTHACVAALLAVIVLNEAPATVGARLRANLGPGWSLIAAMQWLSGKKARGFIDSRLDDQLIGSVAKPAAREIAQIAIAACAQLGPTPTEDRTAEVLRAHAP